ncbi:DUF6773 family protein [Facklamia sp. 7083-14-GEN3]|uniref:DUF6773 family protein n=1 Tax=Facklamia sp. 7083-14-GEN3 TaxID=2973478 RepID=UPI00215D58D7|nr:DUF6773 family protein [Facklamia sp. 7083-14-GEN3]MCR8969601.1 hypothetical protein [Facklamia sp. 7083-14-GEN3]
MKNNILDERIELSKISIKAKAFDLVIKFLFVSMVADLFINKGSWIQIIDKLSIIFLMLAYERIANFYKRNFISLPELPTRTIRLISTILSAIAITIPLSVKNFLEYGEKYSGVLDTRFIWIVIIFFIQFLIYFGVLYFFLIKEDKWEII